LEATYKCLPQMAGWQNGPALFETQAGMN